MSGSRNVYSISFTSADASGVAKGVFEVTPSTQSNISLREVRLGKVAAALSSSAIESLVVSVWRGATDADAGGSTGSGVLQNALRESTHTFAVQLNSSSPGSSAGGAGIKLLHAQAWNTTQEDFVWRPPKDERPSCKLSQRLQVRLSASAGAIVIAGSMLVEETGKVPSLSDS